jgi:putative alpha-1,2-mannosidase
MIRSLLRTTEKTGQFPVEDTEGIHNIAILVDASMKGLTDFDVETAYQAMRACVLTPPYGRPAHQ